MSIHIKQQFNLTQLNEKYPVQLPNIFPILLFFNNIDLTTISSVVNKQRIANEEVRTDVGTNTEKYLLLCFVNKYILILS